MPLVTVTLPAPPPARLLLLSAALALTGCADGCDDPSKPVPSADETARSGRPPAPAANETAPAAPRTSDVAERGDAASEGVSPVDPPEPAPAVLPMTRSGKVLRLPKGGTLKPLRALPPLVPPPSAPVTP